MSALGFFVDKNYLNKVLNFNTIDRFDDLSSNKLFLTSVIIYLIFMILNLLIFSYAIYLSFKRNNGFKLLPFLAAFFLSLLYILYSLAVPVKSLNRK